MPRSDVQILNGIPVMDGRKGQNKKEHPSTSGSSKQPARRQPPRPDKKHIMVAGQAVADRLDHRCHPRLTPCLTPERGSALLASSAKPRTGSWTAFNTAFRRQGICLHDPVPRNSQIVKWYIGQGHPRPYAGEDVDPIVSKVDVHYQASATTRPSLWARNGGKADGQSRGWISMNKFPKDRFPQ